MPPKPKLTKEEKLALKKAKEEERLRLEAEERKRIEEENERLRLEALALQQFRNEQRLIELNNLEKEFDEFQIDQIDKRNISYEKDEEDDYAKQLWEKFREAKEQSIAENEKDMNGFLTYLNETENLKLPDTLKLIKEIFNTSNDVYAALTDCIATVIPDSKSDIDTFKTQRKRKSDLYKSYLAQMYDVILHKLGTSLFKLLRYAERYVNDKRELMIQNNESGVGVGIYCCYSEFYRHNKTVEFDRLGITLEIPKEVLAQHAVNGNDDATEDLSFDDSEKEKLCFRIIQMKIDKYSHLSVDSDVAIPVKAIEDNPYVETDITAASMVETAPKSDLYAIGDFYHIDIFPSPPLAKFDRLMKVTVRDLTQTSPLTTEYPVQPADQYPLKFKMKLPTQLLVSESNVTVGMWNKETSQWCIGEASKGLSNISYNRDDHTMSFEISVVNAIVAFVRSTSFDFPYKSWSLLPKHATKHQGVNDKRCLFEIETCSHHKLYFSFHKNKCKLINPSDDAYGGDASDFLAVMQDLFNKEMRPSLLLHILKRRGLNLIASNEDIFSCDIQPKDVTLEEHVTLSLARCAVGCEISSSRYWNDSLVDTQVGIILKESNPSLNTVHSSDDSYDTATAVDPNKVHYMLSEVDSLSVTHMQAPTVGLMRGSGIKYTLVVGLVDSPPVEIIATDATEDDLKKAAAAATVTATINDTTATPPPVTLSTEDMAAVDPEEKPFVKAIYSNAALEGQVSHINSAVALLNVVSENTSGLLQNYTHERLSRTIYECLRLIRPYSLCQTPVPKPPPPAPVIEELDQVDTEVIDAEANEKEGEEVVNEEDPNTSKDAPDDQPISAVPDEIVTNESNEEGVVSNN